eukprot:29311_1
MASTEEKDVEVAHKLSAPQEEEEVVRPDLYVCLDECYIYSQCGDDNGLPHGDADILYDTIPDEIIQLDVTNRIGKYVRCQKPVAGWVFLPQEEVQYDWGILNEIYQTKKAQEEHLLVYEERRDYTQQRMMMQTVPPDQDFAEINKLMQIKALRWLTFYFRRHPSLPGLIIKGIQLVIDTVILFNVYSDGLLAYEIFESGQTVLFMISCAFIVAPYFLAWKLKQDKDNICQIIGCMLFSISPVGIAFLFAVDIYHWFGSIFYLFTCGKQIRTISDGELGYYKFRRVSVFAEALPQAVLQLLILMGMMGCAKCTPVSVIQALISSWFVLVFWCAIIYFGGKANGMKFVEYVTVIFQGSLWTLYKIDDGEKVNWTLYKIDDEGVVHVAKALNSPHCALKLLKMSKYTIKDLDRAGCRFFGDALAQCSMQIDLIISRSKDDLVALFDQYDVDHSKSLDFEQFVHLCLDITQKRKEPCLRSDVFLIYEELADSVQHEVWQLDLLVKIKGSLEFIGLVDYNMPLQHAYENGDLKMMSLLMAYRYEQHSDENMAEFEHCVRDAVTSGKVREAMCLCEHQGVPIVVRLVNGRALLPSDDDDSADPYVRVSIFDQQQQSSYRKQTLNPNWEEDLLFVVPFEYLELNQDGANKEEDIYSGDVETTDVRQEWTINLRVFDYIVSEDDDFMGSYEGKYNMQEDTSKCHEHAQTVKLRNNEYPQLDAGTISFRVFLNVVQTYQDHQLHYIDSDHEDKAIKFFNTEITEA